MSLNPCQALRMMSGIEKDPRDLEIDITFAISEFILI